MRIPDSDLHAIQARAWRVLQNGTTSGSARALANDALRLTYVMLQNRQRNRINIANAKKRDEHVEMWKYMEGQFGG